MPVPVSHNQPDDFFSSIAEERKTQDPFGADEILFKDENGNLKVLKDGKVHDYEQTNQASGPGLAPARPVQAVMPQPAVKSPTVVAVKDELEPEIKSTFKPLELDQEIDTIAKKSGINLADGETSKRFKNIIRSRLKDVRDQVQTRESLLSSPATGGLGLDAQTTDRVLGLINKELEKMHGRFRDAVSNDQFFELQAEAQKILAEPLSEPEPTPQRPKMIYHPPSQAAVPVEKSEPVIAQSPGPGIQDDLPVTTARPIISQENAKPKIEDVRFRPKLTGPVEEIRTLNLKDFRKLAPTPKGAIDKILEKVALLEEESFSKKVEAVKAWKESEVNRLYLKIGDQSMEEKKSMTEVIAERTSQNQPTLTEEELEAIFELNKKLRY